MVLKWDMPGGFPFFSSLPLQPNRLMEEHHGVAESEAPCLAGGLTAAYRVNRHERFSQ